MALSNKVDNKIIQLDQKVWQSVTRFSANHSKIARFAAIPIFVGTLVRDTGANPLRCAESIILLAKSVYQLATSKEANRKWFYWEHVKTNFGYGIYHFVAIPIGPIVGIIDATATVFSFMRSPIKTAKINACKQDFKIFKKEKDYRYTYNFGQHSIFLFMEDFVSSARIADAIFERFKRQVWSANSSEEVVQMPTFNAQNPLTNRIDLEIRAKITVFNEKRQLFTNRIRANEQNNAISYNERLHTYHTLLFQWERQLLDTDVEFHNIPNSDEVDITLRNLPVYN